MNIKAAIVIETERDVSAEQRKRRSTQPMPMPSISNDKTINIILKVGGQSVNVTRTVGLERSKAEGSLVTYTLDYTPSETGTYDVALRVFPQNEHLPHRMDFALVKWA